MLDVNEAIDLIGQTPFLDFREVPAEAEGEVNFVATELTGRFLKRASLTFDPQTSEPQVSIEFNERGAEIFAELTRKNVGRPLAIFLDGELLSAPIVQQEITGGQAQITGRFSVAEARELARNLNAGALPVPIELISQQTVGPTLGHQSLAKSLVAGFVGFLLVILYMIGYYRGSGVVSALALLIYAALVLAIFKLFSITLTLAGIVGFNLTLGVAIDANILIFERMKEELRAGQTLERAIVEGFVRAKTAIRDAYTSTLITAAVLYWFGTSLVRGFALTLALGLIIAYPVAFIVTRSFLNLLANTKLSRVKFFWAK